MSWELRAAGLAGVAVMLATVVGCSPSTVPVPVGDGSRGPVGGCAAGVSGDVNGDGYAEVAVAEPGDSELRGAVHVFSGQGGGLVVDASGSSRDDRYLTQDTPGVPGTAEAGDAFGTGTLLADLNGDGCADLVVGSPGEDAGAGSVHVFFGSPTGLRTSGVQRFALASLPGSPGDAPEQRFGAEFAAGDLDGDGFDDLVAGVPGAQVGGRRYAGGVAVLFGGSAGLDLPGSVWVTRDSAGVPGSAEEYEGFGRAVATGDFDGSDSTELVVGSSNGLGGGAILVLTWAAGGFTGSAPIDHDAPGLPGEPDRFCDFGSVLASGDVDGDGRDDLAVGDPNFGCHDEETEYGMGAVTVLPGSTAGLTTTGSQLWTQDSPGVEGTARLGNVFGTSLALAPLDHNYTADLVIGAPYDGIGGSVTVLRGSPAGLTTKGAGGARYTQSTPGIPGTAEQSDWFGQDLTAAFVQSRTQATLFVSVPGEDQGAMPNAGSITQIPIGATGPSVDTARTFTADTAGVQGRAQANDYFGGAGGVWG